MSYFVYKLIPPRPTFDRDMSDHERAVMGDHVAFWSELVARGTAIVFGPVADPAGVWGLAVVSADSEENARVLTRADPALTSGVARCEIYPMQQALLSAPRAAA